MPDVECISLDPLASIRGIIKLSLERLEINCGLSSLSLLNGISCGVPFLEIKKNVLLVFIYFYFLFIII